MQQFNLEKWLQDKSRKVVTRDGRPVRIVCTDLKNNRPIIAAIKMDNSELPYYYDINGKCLFYDSKDIFFADEEEELTEFDYAVLSIISDHNRHTDSIEAFAKRNSKKLLDLAKKEICLTCKEYSRGYQEGLKLGREDVLKDLPKWKKITDETNLSLTLSNGEYYLKLEDLETLPKEE